MTISDQLLVLPVVPSVAEGKLERVPVLAIRASSRGLEARAAC